MKAYEIARRAKELKWKWAAHIARRIDGRWAKAVIEWIPPDKKRPRKRPNTR